MKSYLKEMMFRWWYWYVSLVDKKAEIQLMNYGYHDPDDHIHLDHHHESNRYSIQLYHHFTKHVPLNQKDIVEIGSGRGGGISYLTQTFNPKSALGIDLEMKAIEFSAKHHKHPNLKFLQGDAQKLNLNNESVDVVLNVESSHRYPDNKSFLSEVHRILRPNGHFLYTDFRFDYEMEKFKQELAQCGMKIIHEKNINNQVIEALNQDDQRRRDLVKKLTPFFLHKVALNFSGAIDSETYRKIKNQEYVYFSYILVKK
ncbi:MAG: Phthiotriol/phenolphthiotriol dimycocerosates methyltransferase [Bacteroidetes bacterium]|nr:Phthiotriol/phenolphthiotriol dimycocerosates methyltransferase [Bacteroidota bacterium]